MKSLTNRAISGALALGLAASISGCGTLNRESKEAMQTKEETRALPNTNCYLQLTIEEIEGKRDVEFKLRDAKILEGDYSHMVSPKSVFGDQTSYYIETYGEKNRPQGSYCLFSSRRLITENFTPGSKGGIIRLKRGITDCIIPFRPDTKKIIVNANGVLTDLNFNR